MMSIDMMRARHYETHKEDIEPEDACICGYKLRKDGEYINSQNQLTSIMVCDSCGRVEHWVNPTVLIETK